ncbi:MAG: hypothetical protein ABEJ28_08200 [Salinigranum sp.]
MVTTDARITVDGTVTTAEHLRCGECGGEITQYDHSEFPNDGRCRCFRCVICGGTGWEALYLDGTSELGGAVVHEDDAA